MIRIREDRGRLIIEPLGALNRGLMARELTQRVWACRPRREIGAIALIAQLDEYREFPDRISSRSKVLVVFASDRTDIIEKGRPMDAEEMTTETVPANQAGVRLDVYLAARLRVSRGQARRLLDDALVRVDDRVVGGKDKGRILAVGTPVGVGAFRRPEDQRIVPEAASQPGGPVIGILGQGPGWLAIDKRAGAPVHPLREDERGTVLNVVVSMQPEVQGVGEGALRSGVVHRLDVETSGVLLVATEQRSWERLRGAFREHRVEKTYRALVAGNLREPVQQEVGLFVAQHRPAKVRVTEPPTGQDAGGVRIAVQQIRPLEQFANACLVEVRPRTGFLHQIRATLAHLGHPVLGDSIYADSRVRELADRHQLHAARVSVDDVDATSPDPQDFSQLIARLRGE